MNICEVPRSRQASPPTLEAINTLNFKYIARWQEVFGVTHFDGGKSLNDCMEQCSKLWYSTIPVRLPLVVISLQLFTPKVVGT
jgi:hypothetical protein